MRPAIASGIVTGYAPVRYWPIYFPVPGNRPCESKLCPGFSSFLKWRANWRQHSVEITIALMWLFVLINSTLKINIQRFNSNFQTNMSAKRQAYGSHPSPPPPLPSPLDFAAMQ